MFELITIIILHTARLAVVGVAIYAAWQMAMRGVSGWGWFLLIALLLGAFSFSYKTDKVATCPQCGYVFEFTVKDTSDAKNKQ